jgi:phage replication-related protein YjqB (UPF0714/DUF867 family)
MHQDEKISSNFRFECNVDYLNIEMISNDKSVNYEVVLNESYHSRVTFICIWGHMKEICLLKNMLSREETFVSAI